MRDPQHVPELRAGPATVHWGYFSAACQPALTIDPGDSVLLQDVPRIDPALVEQAGVVPPHEIPDNHRAIYHTVRDRGPGPHILVGPLYVRGATPGDTLEVRILEVELAYSYGYNAQRPGQGTLPAEFPEPWQRVVRIDLRTKTAEVASGVIVPLTRPFFGIMGVAPAPAEGRISSGPPGLHGGNLDNRDLGAGATLFLPVQVPGALFSVGDGHAAQGHGEVDLTALETGLQGRFQFLVRSGTGARWPRAETATHWIVMGLHEDLDEAMRIAVRETIDCIIEYAPRLSRQEAYMIASIAVDYHVTQAVSRIRGIHGMIPKALFPPS